MIRLTLALLILSTAIGQNTELDRSYQRFELYNACDPMEIVIEKLSDDARAIGITNESLQVAAESRLRAARLYTDDAAKASGSYLYLLVGVSGRAFLAEIGYAKPVADHFGQHAGVLTWRSGPVIGTHGRDSGFIMSSVYRELDRFLVEYLRVNEEACNEPNKR